VLQTITKLRLAAGLALCLGLAFVPVGCGGSRGVLTSSRGDGGPTIPDATIAELRACVDKGQARLEDPAYTFVFAVEATEDGHADRVKLKDSSPGDGAMESCLAEALEGMRVPSVVVEALSQQAEQAEAVSPASRGLMANPFAAVLGGAISLVPVVLTAAAVTVVVGVAIYASEEIVETVRRRRRSKAQCYKLCDAEAEICEENCRINTKAGTEERRVCWTACNEGSGQCRKKC
jgi:hypothetical protein